MWGCFVRDGCREYLELCSTQANEISTFRAQAITSHRGQKNIFLPPHLQGEMPSFAWWLQDHVKRKLHNGIEVDANLVRLSHPPNHNAYIYNSMWAYGNHYQVDLETWPTHLTYDLGVACIFKQESWSSMRDQNMVVAYLQYVGVLKEISMVAYSSLCVVSFCCFWNSPNMWGNARTICQDEHGFWLVNFARQLPPWKSHTYFLHQCQK
jgi:hypothetical protein